MNINKKILFANFKKMKITKEIKKDVLRHPKSYINCPPRIRMGLFYTDEEYKNRVDDCINKQLSGDEKEAKRLFKRKQ